MDQGMDRKSARMQFNFQLFSRFAARAYGNASQNWYSLADALAVFRWYFEAYERTLGKPHPNIRVAQIQRILTIMPYCEDVYDRTVPIDPQDYYGLIESHFATDYGEACDYNINHFFSGDIRLMKIYGG